MATRESKQALADTAALLEIDTQAARAYLRRVQVLAGPVPYAVIMSAVRLAESTDAGVVAGVAADLAARPGDPGDVPSGE